MHTRWRSADSIPAAWLLFLGIATIILIALTPPLASALAALRPVAFAFGFMAAAAGLGQPLTSRLMSGLDAGDEILASIACGLGLTALLVFAAGLAGVMSPLLFAIWTGAGLTLAAIAAVRRRSWPRPAVHHPLDALAFAMVAPFILAIIPSLVTPPVSTDALEYHLMIPKIHMGVGAIRPIASLVESGYPALASYVYLPVMTLGGDIACKAVHFWVGLALAAAIVRLQARTDPDAPRYLAAAFYLTMPVAASLLSWAWNDSFFVLFVILALTHAVDAHGATDRSTRIRSLVVTGILLGLAAWTKYTIVMVVLALAPLLAAAILLSGWRWREVLAVVGPLAALSLLVFGKNWVFTGNPFFPFLHSLFPSPLWSDHSAELFHEALRRWEIPEWTWITPLLLPLHISLSPRLIDVHTGVAMLMLVPLACRRARSRAEGLMMRVALALAASWLVFQTETRSILTLLAILCVLGSSGLARSVWIRAQHRRAVVALLAVAATVNLTLVALNVLHLTRPLALMFGFETRDAFLNREGPGYPAFEWLNRQADTGTTLVVGHKHAYYLDGPALFGSFADTPPVELLSAGASDPHELARRLLNVGISHIVISPSRYRRDLETGLYSWPEEQRLVFESMLEEACRPANAPGPDRVCRIDPLEVSPSTARR